MILLGQKTPAARIMLRQAILLYGLMFTYELILLYGMLSYFSAAISFSLSAMAW